MVDANSRNDLLSFMDAFFSYNQIWSALEDKENTTFIINHDLFYYRVMLFGLKNVGAIYQCLVNKIFRVQIMWNMEVYVNDMLIKSKEARTNINDLKKAFTILRRDQMK